MNVAIVVVCRQLIPGTPDALQPGNTECQCFICKEAIQASPSAMPAVRAGAITFCHQCGYEVQTRMQAEHPGGVSVGYSLNYMMQVANKLRKAANN